MRRLQIDEDVIRPIIRQHIESKHSQTYLADFYVKDEKTIEQAVDYVVQLLQELKDLQEHVVDSMPSSTLAQAIRQQQSLKSNYEEKAD